MDKFDTISSMLNKAVENNIVYNASYSFIKDNYIKNNYIGVYGTNNLNKVDNNSIYDLASLTKVVGTASMMLKLLDLGKINLDDKAVKFCSNFKDKNITIEELLLHNSGLKADLEDKTNIDRNKIFDNTIINKENYHKTIYSDIGFIILGFIIENITNLNLDKAFKDYIFNSADMNNTSYYPSNKYYCIPTEITDKRGIICGEVHDSKAYALGEIGSAGLFSTLEDLNIFVCSILKDDEKILSHSSIKKLIDINFGDRTLGWDKRYGKYTLYHTGFTGTSILINLNSKEAMIILTNRIHPNRNNNTYLELREEINKIFMEE
ncbi:beta-lactamase family protein [Brachyspira hyodysenteriae]|nr:beta-lactamase family protein [Brachyspira hyodysenteriae]MCZ9989780.1 beta-lactamase family protein [Brachyspira hyodysenteriae]MCZ9998146.1 beta-lactamase family protein [Brachyspira hyodysenteriae]MDA0001580.1 beta-lactamase family protein [Brachyspira hyodysenteriae]MDA0006593.1 beta-lactamase family protein [Brachyspira hyodysenteriae]